MPLFPVVNPIGDAPIFYALTRQYPEQVRRVLARKIAAYSFLLLACSCVFGSVILEFFGIRLFVVQIAGGFVVAATGWNLLNQDDDSSGKSADPGTLDEAMAHAFFPLTLPITVGPGCMSIAITIGAQLRHMAGPGFERGYPRHLLGALTGMLLLSILVLLFYGRAERFVRRLGQTGTTILIRLSAFILFAIGVQIIWNGLGSGVPEILHR